jgi:two-component system cell cycle sensor histidine kinase/response regulator CckA
MAPSIPMSTIRRAAAVPGRELRHRLGYAPVVAATVAVAVGVVVLLGWWLGIDALKSIVPGVLTMKVNTAIAFVLLGTGMLLRARGSRAAVLPLAAVVALSALVGSQYLLGRDLGVDQWLFREPPGQIGTLQPNRMAPLTVVCFLLLGTGLLLVARRGAERIASALFLGGLVIAFGNLLDATFEPTAPVVLTAYTQMALAAAAVFSVVSIGAMSLLPAGGSFAGFAGTSASAKLPRRLLVASVLVPTVLTWLWLRGEDAGFYDLHHGASIVVLGTVIFLAAVIRQTARLTQRSETGKQRVLEGTGPLLRRLERHARHGQCGGVLHPAQSCLDQDARL